MQAATQNTTGNRRRGCLRFMAYGIGGLLFLLLVVVVVAVQIESRNAAEALAETAPPGRLIDVDGRTLHLHCEGEGSPTVLLEAGLGGWSIGWREIQTQLAESTRVCTYDRAGYGWSDPDPEARTAARMAADLHTLLENAEESRPYVLVGASWGAYPVRLFVDRYPDEVAGLVLVDPAHEDDADILPEDVRTQQAALPNIYRVFATAARLGVLRAIGPREMATQAPFIAADVPAATADLYYSAVAGARWWETSLAELSAQEQNAAQMRELAALGALPLVVLGAGEPPEGMGEELLAARQTLLEALAATSTQSRFVVAEGSDHDIAGERPALVVEAIAELIEFSKTSDE